MVLPYLVIYFIKYKVKPCIDKIETEKRYSLPKPAISINEMIVNDGHQDSFNNSILQASI